jgi:asparagine synthase (glutamine-hydrolysing)
VTPRFYLRTVTPRSATRVTELTAAARAEGMFVREMGDLLAVVPSTTSVLPFADVEGFLIGRSFDHDGRRVMSITVGEALAIGDTDGQFAVNRWWGDYVAIWRAPRSRHWHLLRDPGGGAMALFTRQADYAAVFSDVAFAHSLKAAPNLAIDWAELAYGLQFEGLHAHRTALRGLVEVVPGQVVDLTTGAQQPRWLPAGRTVDRGKSSDALQALKRAVELSVDMLVDHRPTVIELSGGLDSSIVATCIRAPGNTTAITLYTPSADGDERDYARAVAAHVGLRLLEVEVDELDLLVPPLSFTVRPTGRSYLSGLDRRLAAAAMQLGVDTVLSGAGGDATFRRSGSPLAVVDAFCAASLRHGWKATGDLATLTDTTILRTALASIRAAYRVGTGRWIPSRSDTEVARQWQQDFAGHPWLAPMPSRNPGARTHIALVARSQAMRHTVARGDGIELVMPLLSQPVVEACLAIPSWHWNDGGVDRAAARAAFRDRLPELIRSRRTKGRLETLIVQAMQRQREEIRSFLLDGLLVANRLVDQRRLDAAFWSSSRTTGNDFALLALLDAEQWVRAIRRLEA